MRYLILLLLAVFVQPVAAQDKGRGLQGSVIDGESGLPLPGVHIVVPGTLRGAVTDLQGRYAMADLPSGELVVEARYIGFRPLRARVAEGRATQDFSLIAETVDLGEVVTTATRFPTSASSVTLRASELPGRPRRSTPELLELVPGLVASQHAGGGKAEQLFLRGFDLDHGTDVALSVDGMPVNLVSHGHGQGYADLHFFLPETIEDVRIEKGPHALDKGDLATAGAVAFSTRDRIETHLVRLDGGSFGGRRGLAMLKTPGNRGYVAAAFEKNDGPFLSPQGLEKSHLFVSQRLGQGLRLSGGVYRAGWTASGQIPQRAVETGQITRFGAIDDTEGGRTGRSWIAAEWQRATGSGSWSGTAYASAYDFRLYSNFTFFLEDPTRGDMIEQTDRRALGGASIRYDDSGTLGGLVLTRSFGAELRADRARVGLFRSPDRQRTSTSDQALVRQGGGGLWSGWTLMLGSRTRLSAGLRADAIRFEVPSGSAGPATARTAAILSPKFSLTVSPAPALDLFLSGGSGFHSNDARSVVRGGPDATPLARAVGTELGLRIRPVAGIRITGAVWRMDIAREFVFVGDAGTTELNGATRRLGLDLAARVHTGRWILAGSTTWSQGRFVDAPFDENAIPLAPRLTASGEVRLDATERLVLAARATHLGRRPLNESRSLEAAPQTIVNLNAGYSIGAVSLDAALINALDAPWNEAQFATESRLRGEAAPVEELHFTPGTPRALRLGVGFQF